MPFLLQILGFVLFILGIGLALWLSIWLVALFFLLAMAAVVWSHLKAYLLAKGILNPKPGVPMDGASESHAAGSIIEGDYKRVDSE